MSDTDRDNQLERQQHQAARQVFAREARAAARQYLGSRRPAARSVAARLGLTSPRSINFPDRDDLGTATIRIDIAAAPRGKPQRVPITTEDFVPLEGPRIYGLSVTISMRQVRIEFRRPPSANPVFAGTFSSSGIFDPLRPHQLDVDFADWKVLSVRMDGESLPMSSGPGKPVR